MPSVDPNTASYPIHYEVMEQSETESLVGSGGGLDLDHHTLILMDKKEKRIQRALGQLKRYIVTLVFMQRAGNRFCTTHSVEATNEARAIDEAIDEALFENKTIQRHQLRKKRAVHLKPLKKLINDQKH